MPLSHHPLKIIHVANLALSPKAPGFFGTPYKISNGLARAGHSVINFSDRDVARASSIFRNRKSGAPGANRKLCRLAADYQPDLILFGHADTIRPETLVELRRLVPHVRLAQWNVDALFTRDNIRRIGAKIDHVDVTFSTTAGVLLEQLSDSGRYRVAFIPNPVDPSIERARAFSVPRDDLRYDLLYAAGSGDTPRWHADIETTAADIVARLKSAVPGFRGCFPGIVDSPVVTGLDYEHVLRSSAMGLNISRRNDVYLYTSDRMAQMMGCGLLTFQDRASGYGEFFSEDEIAFYSSEDELIEKFGRLSTDDALRRTVAEAGWRAYRSLFDATRVARYIADVAMGRLEPESFQWAERA